MNKSISGSSGQRELEMAIERVAADLRPLIRNAARVKEGNSWKLELDAIDRELVLRQQDLTYRMIRKGRRGIMILVRRLFKSGIKKISELHLSGVTIDELARQALAEQRRMLFFLRCLAPISGIMRPFYPIVRSLIGRRLGQRMPRRAQ